MQSHSCYLKLSMYLTLLILEHVRLNCDFKGELVAQFQYLHPTYRDPRLPILKATQYISQLAVFSLKLILKFNLVAIFLFKNINPNKWSTTLHNMFPSSTQIITIAIKLFSWMTRVSQILFLCLKTTSPLPPLPSRHWFSPSPTILVSNKLSQELRQNWIWLLARLLIHLLLSAL